MGLLRFHHSSSTTLLRVYLISFPLYICWWCLSRVIDKKIFSCYNVDKIIIPKEVLTMFVTDIINYEEIENWKEGDNVLIHAPTRNRKKHIYYECTSALLCRQQSKNINILKSRYIKKAK